MQRRHFLAGLATLGLARAVWSITDCQGEAGGRTVCRVGLADSDSRRISRAQPTGSNWCWAACLEMVFAASGYRVSLERIVAEAYGGRANLPADGRLLAQLLSRRWQDDTGRRFGAHCRVLWDVASRTQPANLALTAAERLGRGQPLILGTHGHAVVLTALEYSHAGAAESVDILRASALDPTLGGEPRPLQAWELSNASLLLAADAGPE